MKKHFTEEQIIGFLREADAGMAVKELCRRHGHAGCRFATVPATGTEFWTDKIATNRARDRLKETQLQASGWRIAVVWECALKMQREVALRQLVTFIRSERDVLGISA